MSRIHPERRWMTYSILAVLCLAVFAGFTAGAAAEGTNGLSQLPRESDFSDEYEAIRAILDYHFLVGHLDGLDYGLPRNDFDDGTILTLRQRRQFRALHPETPVEGVYQYPRWAFELMRRLDRDGLTVWNGDVVEASSLPDVIFPFGVTVPLSVVVSSNVNASNNTQVEGETYLAVDPTNQRYLVGASNSLTVNPQIMYRSSDWGATWIASQLPVSCGINSDPWTGFDSLGNAYTSTLDYSGGICGNKNTEVAVRRSTDHGATWSADSNVSMNTGNDKQLDAIDYQTSSPCRDHHYIGWDSGNNEWVASAPAWNGPWTVKTGLDTASIGTDLAVGPPPVAEIYTVWANTTAKQINFSKSVDCGANWAVKKTIATTADGYDYGIPAQCTRRVLIYPSVDIDRSTSPRRGWVYVAWNDFTATNGTCVNATDTNNANVWFSRSTDGGTTWLTPKKVHQDLPLTDQFGQWMRVDDADGTIHVSWYDTRGDSTRKTTNVYYTRSTDGGTTFETETKITTAASDETTAGASGNQYGDYEGLAVRNGVIYPFWTDRRTASDEEVYSATVCSEPKAVGTVTAVDVNACASTGVTISWSAPTIFWGDGGAGTRKYQLFRALPGFEWVKIIVNADFSAESLG